MDDTDLFTATCKKAYFVGKDQYDPGALDRLLKSCNCVITETPVPYGGTSMFFTTVVLDGVDSFENYKPVYLGSMTIRKPVLHPSAADELLYILRRISVFYPSQFNATTYDIIDRLDRDQASELVRKHGYFITYAKPKIPFSGDSDLGFVALKNFNTGRILLTDLRCNLDSFTSVDFSILREQGFSPSILLEAFRSVLES